MSSHVGVVWIGLGFGAVGVTGRGAGRVSAVPRDDFQTFLQRQSENFDRPTLIAIG